MVLTRVLKTRVGVPVSALGRRESYISPHRPDIVARKEDASHMPCRAARVRYVHAYGLFMLICGILMSLARGR